MNLYSVFLLTASISLIGCQTTEILPPKTTPQDENIRTMQADIPDSDGDGVLDDIDECPGTPYNIVIDEGSSIAKNRALMVKNYLILKHDIRPSRLSTFSCDARAPIAPSDIEEGRSLNRRVYGVVTEPEDEIDYQQPNDSKSGSCIEF